MQKTQSKAIIFFLLALVIGIEVVKIKTSFLELWCNCLNNGSFYCNCSPKFSLNHILLHLTNSNFNYCFFWPYFT